LSRVKTTVETAHSWHRQ